MAMGCLKPGDNSFLFGNISKGNCKDAIDGSKPLTYNQCRTILLAKIDKVGCNSNAFGTHSFRSGGASSLAPKVSPFELLLSGRWADARSLRNYVEVSEERRYEISRNLFI